MSVFETKDTIINYSHKTITVDRAVLNIIICDCFYSIKFLSGVGLHFNCVDDVLDKGLKKDTGIYIIDI